ncbi:MAG: Lrp/AsnC family transcriptional regulator [Candidatus Nitrosothermus koennekii]|nr:MAG: Lrp/AsnC family transcriptional regulator [Candidatus Nitrosothermus koennekii]
MRAYVEVFIESGRDLLASADYIRDIDGVIEAYAVSEHCDIMALVEGKDFRSIFELVMRKIRVIRGVIGTRILPCIDMEVSKDTDDSEVTNLPSL